MEEVTPVMQEELVPIPFEQKKQLEK